MPIGTNPIWFIKGGNKVKIFSKDEFYKQVIGLFYKYGVSNLDKKDKYTDIYVVIPFLENGILYEFYCNIRREPHWKCSCQMIRKNAENISQKYVTNDLYIDLRKERLNSTYKLYNFIKNYYSKF